MVVFVGLGLVRQGSLVTYVHFCPRPLSSACRRTMFATHRSNHTEGDNPITNKSATSSTIQCEARALTHHLCVIAVLGCLVVVSLAPPRHGAPFPAPVFITDTKIRKRDDNLPSKHWLSQDWVSRRVFRSVARRFRESGISAGRREKQEGTVTISANQHRLIYGLP